MKRIFSHSLVCLLACLSSYGFGQDEQPMPAEIEVEAEPGGVLDGIFRAFGGDGEAAEGGVIEIEEGDIIIDVEGADFGPFGGDEMPAEFKEMMKAAAEMQKLQQSYEQKIGELIKQAKALEQSDNLMSDVGKVSKLAGEVEELKTKMTAGQKEMMKKMGLGGAIIEGGFGGGGFGGGFGGGAIEILPVLPFGGDAEAAPPEVEEGFDLPE